MTLDEFSGLSDICWLLSSAIKRIRIFEIYIVTTNLFSPERRREKPNSKSPMAVLGLVGCRFVLLDSSRSSLHGRLLIVLEFCDHSNKNRPLLTWLFDFFILINIVWLDRQKVYWYGRLDIQWLMPPKEVHDTVQRSQCGSH